MSWLTAAIGPYPAGPYGPYGKNYPGGRLVEKVVFHVLRLGGQRLAHTLGKGWLPLGRLFCFKPGPINLLIWLAAGQCFVPWKDLETLDSTRSPKP